MANPAPTINQINAFNATQGTTIDFNIIGGTELVRSNKIYIYDLSDNSLICTHLYVSTESIHELPPNTDGSIVYESGKSSADFVNGAQYYAQIQTFTDIAGTEGGSGLSVAKMFWCLVDPTLTITTIPSTISTTSYNISATYNANTSVVSNIIQQYQFNLYNATGSLLQSSGVIVGSGTQQGTSTAYDISYNFSGLSVGSSYYVTVEVTTTQGMSVTTQSNTFTVSIDTPTLGEATVVNNACDGYISVTSNLSSEYGGSGSGDIVSFETDSENVFTKLQVDLDPLQDLHGYDKPWVGGAGKNKFDKDNPNVVNGYITSSGFAEQNIKARTIYIPINPDTTYTVSKIATARFAIATSSVIPANEASYTSRQTGNTATSLTITSGASDAYLWAWVYLYDTDTESYNDVIDSIQIEEGSFATAWTPYSNICPISGWSGVDVARCGINVWDEVAEVGGLNVNTGATTVANRTRSKNYIPCVPNTSYYWKLPSSSGLAVCYYDASKTFVSGAWVFENQALTTPANAYFMKFCTGDAYGTTYNNDISINYPSTDHDYHAYNGKTISVQFKDENDNVLTVYGGRDEIIGGELTVTHASVDMGDLNWVYSTGQNNYFYSSSISDFKFIDNATVNYICSAYESYSVNERYKNGYIFINSGQQAVVVNENYTNASTFKTDMTGQKIVYELATPTTYQLTPQQIQTLVGVNNVWSEQGDVEVAYHIPITNLLVKRQDVDDVSGNWLTLYSQPITQASDMDFTFIDFTNQYGKTYKYALVPLLTQQQSGVEVEVEGGYTVSDKVQSIFDGVFIADSTGLQKCKANVGYGNVDMNQVVGSITPIGAKYPIVITNSQNQYHNGSISGTIVPDDYYFNGNLSRIDMVNKRDELEQFLTNKRAKIIKDWNGNIWLVMIMDNVSCTFNNSYGMGIVNFSTNWLEVGDPTNQQDLQATGLINVGGV